MSPPGFHQASTKLFPLLYGKTIIIFITSFSQYTTICFVSFFFIRFSMNNFCRLLSAGGDDGIRTHDPLLAGQVLSQLSYTPIFNECLLFLHRSKLYTCLVGPSGLEPPTSCLSGTRSNLLSYEPMWLVSDFRHLGFFRLREQIALLSLPMSALSYFPVQSPAKYFHHCRA